MTFHTTIQQLDLGNTLLGAERIKSARIKNDRDALSLELDRRQAQFTQLPADHQKAVRERAEAVGWLARTVADAAPGLRAARYEEALEQARTMGIPVGNLPAAYHAGLDPLLRQYADEAQAFLGRLGDRGAK